MNVHKIAASVILGTTLLTGCATQPHSSVALTGRVADRLEMDGTKGSYGAYRPGMGGALGGVVAHLLVSAKSSAPYHFYELQLDDGTARSVPSREEHAVGECLTVMVASDKTSLNTNWQPEDVTLQPSTACKPLDTVPKFAFTARVVERFGTVGSKDAPVSGTSPVFAYEVKLNDGTTRGFPSREEHAVGECLDVWVDADKASMSIHLKPENIALRSSAGCKANDNASSDAARSISSAP